MIIFEGLAVMMCATIHIKMYMTHAHLWQEVYDRNQFWKSLSFLASVEHKLYIYVKATFYCIIQYVKTAKWARLCIKSRL